MIRLLLRGLGAAVVVLCLALAVSVVFLVIARRHEAQVEAIRTPRGIDEERFVRLNGVDQWITIRGEDRRKPVLLILHGGPGEPTSFLVQAFRPIERHYVVVQWDQRGSGKTLARAGGHIDPRLDMATMVSDGVAVSDYLRQHLGAPKIILLGHSWGSVLGVFMVQARPDLYAAFVGTGQIASSDLSRQQWVYARLAQRMTRGGDQAGLAELRAAGPPPWTRPGALKHVLHAAGPYRPPALSPVDLARALLIAPHWSLSDARAAAMSRTLVMHTTLWTQAGGVDYGQFGRSLGVPLLVIQGADDDTSPADLARAWFSRVRAPAKAFVVVPGQGHQALLMDNAEFTRALDENLPALMAAGRRP